MGLTCRAPAIRTTVDILESTKPPSISFRVVVLTPARRARARWVNPRLWRVDVMRTASIPLALAPLGVKGVRFAGTALFIQIVLYDYLTVTPRRDNVLMFPAGSVNRGAIADEYGRLSAEIAAFKPKIARHKQLRETIEGWFENEDASKSFAVEGSRFVVEVGPKALKRTIKSMHAVYKRLGVKAFLEACSFTLEALEERLSATELGAYLNEKRTGSRSVRPAEKSMAEVA